MAVCGIAYGSMVVSSFSRASKKVLEMGFADDINTKVLVSGQYIKNLRGFLPIFYSSSVYPTRLDCILQGLGTLNINAILEIRFLEFVFLK